MSRCRGGRSEVDDALEYPTVVGGDSKGELTVHCGEVRRGFVDGQHIFPDDDFACRKCHGHVLDLCRKGHLDVAVGVPSLYKRARGSAGAF